MSVQHLWKSYPLDGGRVPALCDVSLTIGQSEHVAIMGSSGSGKSTLLNVLGILDRWDRGAYRLAGHDVGALAERQAARLRNELIGFVFQSFHLLPTKSAWENVALPLTHRGVSRRSRRRQAEAMLDRLGLADRRTHKPNELSGGQRQRVAIARALVTNPPLILADEPTGNLDSETTGEVLEVLDAIHQEGRTVVVVTHEHEVASRASRRIVMKDARIVEG
ncbi:MAG: ABC transporter ATP-binding protein [Myxococcota bacterium]